MVVLKANRSMVLTVNGIDMVIKKGGIYELPHEFGKGSYTQVLTTLPCELQVKKQAYVYNDTHTNTSGSEQLL
jgi:hypothetical protein